MQGGRTKVYQHMYFRHNTDRNQNKVCLASSDLLHTHLALAGTCYHYHIVIIIRQDCSPRLCFGWLQEAVLICWIPHPSFCRDSHSVPEIVHRWSRTDATMSDDAKQKICLLRAVQHLDQSILGNSLTRANIQVIYLQASFCSRPSVSMVLH